MKNLNIKIGIVWLIFCLSFSNQAYAQMNTVPQLESQIKRGIAKAYAASVRIWGFDTVRKVQNSAQFSGAVVDKEGIILTVSHAIQPGKTYKVRFPDGRETLATALGKIGLPEKEVRPDLGMIKLNERGDWPIAEMGWSSSIVVDEPCIGISYPETLNQLLPTVRFGKITNVLNESGFIASTTKMEPGDSGGPLFDYSGRLIGMHSRCLKEEEGNFDVPIDAYRKYWTALKTGLDYKFLPDSDRIETDLMNGKAIPTPFIGNLKTPIAVTKGNVVQLHNRLTPAKSSILATAIDYKGKLYLISKSSMVEQNMFFEQAGEKVAVSIIARDSLNDLVLMTPGLNAKGLTALKMYKDSAALQQKDLGSFLISPIGSSVQVSVLSSAYFKLPRKFSVGYLGASSTFQNGKILLTRLNQGSPANLAGLKVSDQVVAINAVKVNSANEYNLELFKYNPGDEVVFELVRNSEMMNIKVKLEQRPPANHWADMFSGGKSAILDGFEKVFSHDAVIKPEECGGPVLDRNGNLYGLNIARFSRTSCIALPTSILMEFIRKSLARMK